MPKTIFVRKNVFEKRGAFFLNFSRSPRARAGLMRAHTLPYGHIWARMGPHGPFLAQKGPLLTNHLLTYHVAAPEKT